MAGLLAQPARVTRVAVPASSPLASPAFISPSRFSAAAHGRIAARQRKSLAVRAAAAGDSSGDGDNVVTLLDYGAGNVRSVRNAIRLLGYEINDVSGEGGISLRAEGFTLGVLSFCEWDDGRTVGPKSLIPAALTD
ncbi:unnamed protein product [Closterium sp. NIES-53]